MTTQWDFKKRLQLLYKNMLPIIKRHVPYDHVTDETTLLRLARDAEKLILDERNYVPPPLPAQTVFPELAYREDSQARAPRQSQVAVAAISAPEKAHDKADLLAILSRLAALETSFSKSNKNQQQSNPKPNYKGNNGKGKGSSGSDIPIMIGLSQNQKRILRSLTQQIMRLLRPETSQASRPLLHPKPGVRKSFSQRRI